MRQLIIMHGISGSGKSTAAKKYEEGIICSADDYFNIGGEYNFDFERLQAAHGWCQIKAHNAMVSGAKTVVIDNTNLKRADYIIYEEMAQALGYKTVHHWMHEKELPESELQKFANRNQHGLTLEQVQGQYKKMEK